jgi:hypothetical protein
LPGERAIGGMDLSALLAGDAGPLREEFLYYSRNGQIAGIRRGD